MNKSFPLSKVYGLLEPGPVVLVTSARMDRGIPPRASRCRARFEIID